MGSGLGAVPGLETAFDVGLGGFLFGQEGLEQVVQRSFGQVVQGHLQLGDTLQRFGAGVVEFTVGERG